MKQKLLLITAGVACTVALAAALPALAQTDNSSNGSAAVTTTSAPAPTTPAPLTAAETKQLKRIITVADKEIDRRTASLTDLGTRLQGLTQLSPQAKSSLSSDVQTQLTALGQLKAKIDADTDLATAKTDRQTVISSYRIFALIIPKYRIVAAADRMDSITSILATIGLKVQTRVDGDKTAGADVTAALATLADLQAKLNDAKTQYSNALQGIAPLQPDNGDKTLMASNTAALKAARALLKTAQADLVAARKDVQTLITWLKTVKIPAASTGATTAPTATTPNTPTTPATPPVPTNSSNAPAGNTTGN